MKLLWFDVETTGLDPEKHSMIQLAGMLEIEGEVVSRFNFRMKPFPAHKVEPGALERNGITVVELNKYPLPGESYERFLRLLQNHVDQYDSRDKFWACGYNIAFDVSFLKAFFLDNGDKYLHSYVSHAQIDVLSVVRAMSALGTLKVSDYKLSSVCRSLGIEIRAHDALSDIEATREVLHRLMV